METNDEDKNPASVVIITILVTLAVISLVTVAFTPDKPELKLTPTQEMKAPREAQIGYKVVKEVTRVGLPSQNRAIIKILFDTVPTEEAMRQTATRLWQQNRQWKEFTVFIYLPGMATDDDAYGMFEFGPNGLQDSFINTTTKP